MLGKNLIQAASGNVAGLPEIGDFYQGGYFVGYISLNANSTATHGLLVAPKSTQQSSTKWKTTNTTSSGTSSTYDGLANTQNMSDSSHPAANYCANLTTNGFTDWYLPSKFEFEIAYYNCKPTSSSNFTIYNAAVNPYAVPARTSNYTSSNPPQTSVSIFQQGGAQAFDATSHWSSTEFDYYSAIYFEFGAGRAIELAKNDTRLVRAFRRFAV